MDEVGEASEQMRNAGYADVGGWGDMFWAPTTSTMSAILGAVLPSIQPILTLFLQSILG